MFNIDYLKTAYLACAFTHDHIGGFISGNDVYAVMMDSSEILAIARKSVDSKRKEPILKLHKPTDTLRRNYLKRAFVVGTVDELDAFRVVDGKVKFNRGDAFEALLMKFYNLGKWSKSSERFDEGADITVNGKPYSVKFLDGEPTLITTLAAQKAMASRG